MFFGTEHNVDDSKSGRIGETHATSPCRCPPNLGGSRGSRSSGLTL